MTDMNKYEEGEEEEGEKEKKERKEKKYYWILKLPIVKRIRYVMPFCILYNYDNIYHMHTMKCNAYALRFSDQILISRKLHILS